MNMCGQRLAAWKYRPCGMRAASSGTNTSLKIKLRDTVARMPSGSQSPSIVKPGAVRGMARYRVSRRERSAPSFFSVQSTPK